MENDNNIKIVDPRSGKSISDDKNILSFVDEDNYTASFGYQWNKFEKTQIDRYNQAVSQSEERLFKVTGWHKNGLKGENILEVGSGAGRFSRVVLEHTQANLYSVDYSSAVEANYRNNSHYSVRLKLFQASIYELPFAPKQFDKVFCFGVLQHTPNFKKSVECLCKMVKTGGELVIDFYPIRGWWTKIHAKYLLRPLTKRMRHDRLLELIEKNTDWMIGLYQFLDKIGLHVLTRFLPICDIRNTLPENLADKNLREWVILDTFDMFSPEYDRPQKIKKIKKLVSDLGGRDVIAKIVNVNSAQVYSVRAKF